MKTHVGPMIRLIQWRLNSCSPLIWSRNLRRDGVEEPPTVEDALGVENPLGIKESPGELTDQENVALLNPISSSRSIVVGIPTSCAGVSANESNNSDFCRNSVIRSNETLAGETQLWDKKSNTIEEAIPWIVWLICHVKRCNCILKKLKTVILEKILEAKYIYPF